MKQIFTCIIFFAFYAQCVQAQSFNFAKDVHVFFISADSGSCTIEYTTNSNPALTIAPSTPLPAGYTLSPSSPAIAANSPSGSFRLNYPAAVAGLISLKLFATNGNVNIDTTDIYFIPESQRNTFVSFGPNTISSIEEPKDGVSASKNVVATVQAIFPYNSQMVLSIDYAKSDFPNVTSPTTQTISYLSGSAMSVVMPLTINGSNDVKDDRKLVFIIKDEYGHVWAMDTVDVKSYENSTKVKSLRAYMSLGGSYDFLKGVDRPLSAYSELYVRSNGFSWLSESDKRSIVSAGKSINRWSFSGHYYAATVVSTRDTIQRTTEHIPFADRNEDTLRVISGLSNQVRVNSSNFYTLAGRLNFNVLPQLRDEHQLLAYLNFEGLIRRSEQRYTNIESPIYDTTAYALADLPRSLRSYSYTDPSLKATELTRTRFEGYGGLGLRYEWETEELQFMIDAGIGAAFYDLRSYTPDGFPNTAPLYWNNQFSLIVKSIGVKFGGDIRSKINAWNSENNLGWKPLTTLYLAKTLSFNKLGDFVKGVE